MRQFDVPGSPDEAWLSVARFVRARSKDILDTWLQTAQGRPIAKDIPSSSQLAHVSPLLNWLAEREDSSRDMASLVRLAGELAGHRMEEGLDLREVLAQYSILRDCLIHMWGESAVPAESWPGMIVIDRVFDTAAAASIAQFDAVRDRTLDALERVSTEGFESSTLNELLQRLMLTFQEIAPAVDLAAILLRRGDEFVTNTIVGVDPQVMQETVDHIARIGEGFVGRIAVERRPVSVRNAATNPLVLHPVLKSSGIRAAYGVPLIEGGNLVGVAVIGSYTAWDFPKSDRIIFDVVARKAASAVSYMKSREAVDIERVQLVALLAQMPSGVLLADSASGKMTLYNNQAELIWRRPFRPSMPIEEYTSWPAYRLDGRRLEREEWPLVRAIHEGKVTINQEIEIMRGDGSRGTLLVSSAPIRAADARIVGGVSTFVDVTEKRLTERQLKTTAEHAQRAATFQRTVAEASQRLAEAFEEGDVVGSIIRLALPRLADWCFVHELAEDGQLRLLEFAHIDPMKTFLLRDLLQNRPNWGEPGPDTREALKDQKSRIYPDVTEELIRERVVNHEQWELVRQLGLVSMMILPLVARGRTVGVIRFGSAESRRRFTPDDLMLAEELARHSAYAIDNARLYRKTREAVQQREDLMAIISHDLRNPLNVVVLSARQLTSEASQGAGCKNADIILRAASRMQNLVRNLMDFAAVGAGQLLSIERKEVDVEPVIVEVLSSFDKPSRDAGVALLREVEADLPHVSCDPDRFIQVLENLVSNALKVTPSGGTVTIRAARDDNYIRFSVADTGPGIPTEELPHLFERYFRGRFKAGKGLGLGLPIAKALVEGHGGRIWAESEPGRGSVFHFTLPRAV
jgi:signal transduction histidine kinase/PAS domain-containing protein